MRFLLFVLLGLGAFPSISTSATAPLGHCEGYVKGELGELAPSARIEWLTEELARCDLGANDKFELYFERGTAFFAAGYPRRATEDFDIAIEMNPYATEVFINRAVALTDLGLYEQAAADYTTALEIDPEHVLAHNGLAWTLYESGKELENALAHSEKAVALESDFWGFYDTYGHVLAAVNRPADAMAAFERALALSDDDNIRLYQTGLAANGFDPGPIDGLYGKQTRAALEACVRESCNIWAQ